MNSAYGLANMNQSQLDNTDLHHSMWYFRGISSPADFNPAQQWIMALYSQFEEYLDAINVDNKFHEGLNSI